MQDIEVSMTMVRHCIELHVVNLLTVYMENINKYITDKSAKG